MCCDGAMTDLKERRLLELRRSLLARKAQPRSLRAILRVVDTVVDVRVRQDAEMQAIAHELALKSTVAAQRYDTAGGGHPQSKAPPGAWVRESCHFELDRLLARYAGAMSTAGREAVLVDARTELASWKRTTVAPAGGLTFEQLVIADGEGFDPEQVGRHFGISPAHVARIRRRNKRGMEDGRPLEQQPEHVPATIDARRAEVARMRAQGLTRRQIAMILHVTHRTVGADLAALGARA